MAKYSDIQDYIKRKHGYSCKSCWIAHMKEVCGLNPKQSHNRYSSNSRTNPCPPDKQQDIINAFKHFGMIGGNTKVPQTPQGCATTMLIVVLIIYSIIAFIFS